MSRFDHIDSVRVTMPRAALITIYDECDRHDDFETGGRVIGVYDHKEEQLHIHVQGIIGPGQDAQRSATSFFQDGEYQERVFRQVEAAHPSIEHLGNWHTHHVNGFPELSSGDIATYRRTVDHENHNTTFFYALLVVSRRRGRRTDERYEIKHYLVRRNDPRVYQIPASRVTIVDEPLVCRVEEDSRGGATDTRRRSWASPERFYDQTVLDQFYSGLRPYRSERLGLYWRGTIELVDGSRVELVAPEQVAEDRRSYSVLARDPPPPLRTIAEELAQQEFPSARLAIRAAERLFNETLFRLASREHSSQ